MILILGFRIEYRGFIISYLKGILLFIMYILIFENIGRERGSKGVRVKSKKLREVRVW